MPRGKRPLISVIVPAHNAAASLPAALASVQAAHTEEVPLELVVVDDGSTDDTAAVARQAGARCVSQPNAGAASARNSGVRQARGELLAFIDADDLWAPRRSLAREAALLHEQAAELCWGLTQLIRCLPEGESAYARPWRPPLFGSVLVTRRGFEHVGPLCEQLRDGQGEDFEWFARARDRGLKIATLDEVTLHYRIHAANLKSHQRQRRNQALFTALRSTLQRRLAAAPRNEP